MSLRALFFDKTLYGHGLTSMPEEIWAFSQGDFSFYDRPDPGTRVVIADHLIAQKIHYRKGDRWIFKTEVCIEKPLLDLIEFVARRILAPCQAAASLFLLAPLGLIAKLVHVCLRQVTASLQNPPFGEKIQRIWGDSTLFGHALTSAPAKLGRLTTAPFHWHLRPDGTDRRIYIATFGRDPDVIRQSEYEFVPFELFEGVYRGFTGAATFVAGALSPLGLAAKAAHLAARSLKTNLEAETG